MLKTVLKSFSALAAGVVFLSMVSAPARASVVFVFEGTSAGAIAGQTNFKYDLNFVTTPDAGTGQPNDNFVPTTTFGTLYDIVGFVSATLTPGSPFAYTVQNIGVTPIGIAPTDGNALPNITIVYTGPATTASTSFPLLLTVSSTASSTNVNGQYSGQDVKNAGASAGSLATNFGFVAVPASSTPEPASMFMMGSGALLLLVGRFRAKKA